MRLTPRTKPRWTKARKTEAKAKRAKAKTLENLLKKLKEQTTTQ